MRLRKANEPGPEKGPVAARVWRLRRALKLSQEQLAADAGLERVVVNRIEAGTNKLTSYPARTSLAKGFGLSVDELDAYLADEITVDAAIEARRRRAEVPQSSRDDEGDPLPERAAAVRWARAAGYPEPVIEMAYRARKGPRLSFDEWIDRLRLWRDMHERDELHVPGEPATEDDFAKPRRS